MNAFFAYNPLLAAAPGGNFAMIAMFAIVMISALYYRQNSRGGKQVKETAGGKKTGKVIDAIGNWWNGVDDFAKDRNTLFCYILAAVAVFVGMLLYPVVGLLSDDSDLRVVFIILLELVLGGALWGFFNYCSKVVSDRQKKHDLAVQFWQECGALGIRDLSNSYDREKAKLLAKRLGCTYGDFDAFFAEAKQIALGEEMEQKEEEFRQLRETEAQRIREYTRYAPYRGRDKRLAILEDARQAYLEKADRLEKSTMDVIRGSQQREIDWAVAGGFASGLAGPAAGIAAALDAQSENVRIRAENRAILDALSPGIFAVMNDAGNCRAEARKLEKAIADAEIKVVADTPDRDVFSWLAFSDTRVSISETGNFSVQTTMTVEAPSGKRVIGHALGVVDGTVAAELYQNGECMGTALLVLPVYGVRQQAKLEGMALADADPEQKWKIKFKPHRLWLMEE